MDNREYLNWQNLCTVVRKLKDDCTDSPVTHAELAELLEPLFEVIQDMRPENQPDD